MSILFVKPVAGGKGGNVALPHGFGQLKRFAGAVARGEDARDRGGHAAVRYDAAVFIGQTGNQLGYGDGVLDDEDTVDRMVLSTETERVCLLQPMPSRKSASCFASSPAPTTATVLPR